MPLGLVLVAFVASYLPAQASDESGSGDGVAGGVAQLECWRLQADWRQLLVFVSGSSTERYTRAA